MDYDSDSSDFHFPSDTGLAKLSSPLSFKVPESRDWALEEFMQTLQEKPCTEAENLLSIKQYIPVSAYEDEDEEEDEDYNYGPPKLTLPSCEEKEFLSQLSQHCIQLERLEILNILKDGFAMVQNDIQSNNNNQFNRTPAYTMHPPGLSWFNEAVDYGRPEIGNLDTIEIPKRKNNFSPFDESMRRQSSNNNNATMDASERSSSPEQQQQQQKEVTTVVLPNIEKPLPPLPATEAPLPQAAAAVAPTEKTKKGLKYKLKQKLVKPFNNNKPTSDRSNNNGSEKPKMSLFQNTKKLIRKMLH